MIFVATLSSLEITPYMIIEFKYFELRSGAVKHVGNFLSIICTIFSLFSSALILSKFGMSCFYMTELTIKDENRDKIKTERRNEGTEFQQVESQQKQTERRPEGTESRQKGTDSRQEETENRQEGTENKQDTESRQENIESRQKESRQQKMIDPKDHPKQIITSFNGLKSAWSPIIALTYTTQIVLLISGGFAFSILSLTNDPYYETYRNYEMIRSFSMTYMIIQGVFFILYTSFKAEQTHTIVKEFGTEVR